MIARIRLAVTLVVTLVLGLLLAPLSADADRPLRIPVIDIIEYEPSLQPFLQALRDLGYVEGQNIAIEPRSGAGAPDRLANVAAELVRLKVDVLVTLGTPATRAAKQATRSPSELESAFAAMMRERPDAFMMTADPMHLLHTPTITTPPDS